VTIDRFFVRAVTIQHPVLVASGYNSLEPSFATPTEVEVLGWLHQLAELEHHDGTRDAEISTHVLRLPVGTVIGAGDRVVIDGQTFEVDGATAKNWRPSGAHHVEASLRYMDG